MNYNAFKSIVSSRKQPIPLSNPLGSFYQQPQRPQPYIEPRLSKLEFPVEKPPLLLVTAMGASGKTTTARSLSADIGLPVLDLAAHKPVGDNTLTGILTSAYAIEKVGEVLQALRAGTNGIIIDGIDEARSKTSELAFEAFLDDLIERSKGAASPAIIVFGRGQVLLDVWCYLADKGAQVGVVQIDPFDLTQAKNYIDSLAAPKQPGQYSNYEQARDGVLEKLGSAVNSVESHDSFLAFLGYPPVLDAIATLLCEERNYHRVNQAIDGTSGTNLGVKLLLQISHYLLDREQNDKALPNFIRPMLADVPESEASRLERILYDRDEQCARILAAVLQQPFPRKVMDDRALCECYEEKVATWSPEHPFLINAKIRNPVFSAVAVARCVLSRFDEYRMLARAYAAVHPQTSHLLHIMRALVQDGDNIPVSCFNMLMQSCNELVSIDAPVVCEISGDSWEDVDQEEHTTAELSIYIEHPEDGEQRTLTFHSVLDMNEITLGPVLLNVRVTLPCDVHLQGIPTLSVVGDCAISARRVRFETGDIVVRPVPVPRGDLAPDCGLLVTAEVINGHSDNVTGGAGTLMLIAKERDLDYPLAVHARTMGMGLQTSDPDFESKLRRLRRILSEFRSHSRGSLAKYRAKIEHQRVLQNEIGRKVLEALLRVGVLRCDRRFYYVDTVAFDREIGITWHQLRQYETSENLERFLRSVRT